MKFESQSWKDSGRDNPSELPLVPQPHTAGSILLALFGKVAVLRKPCYNIKLLDHFPK